MANDFPQRDEILRQIFSDQEYKSIAKRRDGNGDLYGEFCLYICEMPEEKLFNLVKKNYLKFHCISVLLHSSSFITKYRQKESEISEEHFEIEAAGYDSEFDHKFERLETALKNENWYDRQIFLMATTGHTVGNRVVKYKSLLHLSRETGIPYKSILHSYKSIQQRVASQV